MKWFRIAAALAVTSSVIVAAALASGANGTREAHVRVAAIGTEIISTGPVASGVSDEKLDGLIVMEESQGWLATTDYGGQTELAPDDELFDIVRFGDLPSHLRTSAGKHSFSSPMYEGVDGNVDGVMMFATNIAALLPGDGAAYQNRGVDVQELYIPPAPTEPATTNVYVMVMRFPSEDAVDHIFGEIGETEGELRVALQGIDDSSGFDLDEAIRDSERTYSERRREALDVAGLGDNAYGEAIAVAVLDYDRLANEYRSDRILSWQYTESVGFTVGRYAVSISRSAVSPNDVLAQDTDIAALATAIAERLAEIVP